MLRTGGDRPSGAREIVLLAESGSDLGRVGRYKINQRLMTNRPASETVLTKEDFVAIIRYLVELHEGRGYTDDIDHSQPAYRSVAS